MVLVLPTLSPSHLLPRLMGIPKGQQYDCGSACSSAKDDSLLGFRHAAQENSKDGLSHVDLVWRWCWVFDQAFGLHLWAQSVMLQ